MRKTKVIHSMTKASGMLLIPVVLGILALIILSENDLVLVNALNATDTATFNITIAAQAAVDINPNSSTWESITPGNYTTSINFTIDNIGSVNITEIWADTTNPSSNPFGTDNPLAYDTGNFVQVSNNSVDYYFVDTLEFNTSRLPYITYRASNVAQGRFRFAEQEYFWDVVNQTATNVPGGCASASTFAISGQAHNRSHTGDTNLNDGTPATVTLNNNSGATWGMGNLPAITGLTNSSSNATGYCVAVNAACTQVRLFKYNKFIGSDPTDDSGRCTTDGPFIRSANGLAPGAGVNINIRAAVPFGVPDGELTIGTLTLKATSE